MDFPAKPKRNAEVKLHAKTLRDYFGLTDTEYVDVFACLRSQTILTVNGEKNLTYEVVDDAQMRGQDAVTIYSPAGIAIRAKKSVDFAASMGDGRARNTLAHELGHAMMHDGAPKARGTGARGVQRPRYLKAYESAEHQVKVFAPAFLIHDHLAATELSAKAISLKFGISFESASIYFDELTKAKRQGRCR